MLYTLNTAQNYANEGKIEEWIHMFLNSEGNNIPFSEGLKLEKRYFIGPIKMPLFLFERCCGPEEGIKYCISKQGFENRVKGIQNHLKTGWSMPPLIINYETGRFELNDGNHRYEALLREGITSYYVIIWITKEADFHQFLCDFSNYL